MAQCEETCTVFMRKSIRSFLTTMQPVANIVVIFCCVLILEHCNCSLESKESLHEDYYDYINYPDSEEYPDLQPRIIGGRPSRPGEFPYQLQLTNMGRYGYCGATLVISPSTGKQIGVTAAHCIQGPPSTYTIRAGSVLIDDPMAQELTVTHIIAHENFNQEHFGSCDIALIFFNGEFILDDETQPLALPEKDHVVNEEVIVTGWGQLQGGKYHPSIVPRTLQVLKAPIVPNKKCIKIFKRISEEDIIDWRNFCAGDLTGDHIPCNGDSGGPAMTVDKDGNRFFAGVVSFGAKQCGAPDNPGVFTKISAFLDWIDKTSANLPDLYPSSEDYLEAGLREAADEFEDSFIF